MRVVVTDMSSAYRKGLHSGTAAHDDAWHDAMVLLPAAVHVVDRFHVVRNFLKFQVAMRRALQGAAGPGERRELQQARYPGRDWREPPFPRPDSIGVQD